jgi:hypothetical protein
MRSIDSVMIVSLVLGVVLLWGKVSARGPGMKRSHYAAAPPGDARSNKDSHVN